MQKIARRRLAGHVAQELQSGADVRSLAGQVVAYLHEQKQLNQWELLIRDVETILATEYGIVSARVSSARPLDDAARTNLEDFLKSALSAKQVVVSEETVNEDLIGGVIIETPSSTFDGSVRGKLQQLAAITKE